MRKTRVGVIGSGYWGPNIIRNFVEIPACELYGIADLDADKLIAMRERYPQVTLTTTDYHELFDADLDAVAICTPPQTHYAIARECLEAGLHVLIEKPITTSSTDTQALIEMAEQRDLALMVGHTFEYNPAVRELRHMIERGDVGDIRYIDTVRVGLGLYNPNLNVIWDLAPHDISILIYLLGEAPVRVSAEAVACMRGVVEDVAYLTFVFPSGVVAHARVSWLDPSKTRRTTVVGSEKMVIYDDVEPNEKLRVFDKGVEARQGDDSFGEFQFNYRYGDIVSPFIEFKEPLRVQCQHFLECVDKGLRPLTDGENGLRVIEVIEALQESLTGSSGQVDVKRTARINGTRSDIDLTTTTPIEVNP